MQQRPAIEERGDIIGGLGRFRIISLLLFGCRRSVLIHIGKNSSFLFYADVHDGHLESGHLTCTSSAREPRLCGFGFNITCLGLSSTLLARLVAVWRCCCSRARAQLIEVAFCNFGGGAINVYVLYRRHLVVFARLPPPLEVWVPCFSATAFWVGFLSARTIEGCSGRSFDVTIMRQPCWITRRARVYTTILWGAICLKIVQKAFFLVSCVSFLVSIICSDFINPATDYSKSHTGYILDI